MIRVHGSSSFRRLTFALLLSATLVSGLACGPRSVTQRPSTATSAGALATPAPSPSASEAAAPTPTDVTPLTPTAAVDSTATASSSQAAVGAAATAPANNAAAPTATPAGTQVLAAQAPAGTPDACQIKSLQPLSVAAAEGWPGPQVQMRKDSAGDWQTYVSSAFGAPGTCITCTAHPGGPPVDRFHVMAHTDPANHWIVVVGEAETHPGSRRPINQDMIFELQNGYWSNMYVTTVDGQHWYQLTHFSANQGPFGVIAPHFSRDGKQITWGQAIRAPTRAQVYGQWQLKVADFVVDANGVPSLQNIRTYTGPGGHFYEPESWSADDSKVLLSADIGMPSVYGLDIFTLDVATGQFTNLTNTPEQWDEHAHYSPAGNKIIWMSSSPVPNLVRILPPNVTYGQVVGQYLKTELWMMNSDGSGKQELTYFSTPGHPEYQGGAKVNVDESLWNADGSQVFVGARGAGPGPWLLTFAGRCGGS